MSAVTPAPVFPAHEAKALALVALLDATAAWVLEDAKGFADSVARLSEWVVSE